MRLWMCKDNDGKFHPYMEGDRLLADKIPIGEDNFYEMKRVRSPGYHRRYFAMVNMGFNNQDEFPELEGFRQSVQQEAGYVEYLPFTCRTDEQKTKVLKWLNACIKNLQNDRPLQMPFSKSIAYEKLDQTGFAEVYRNVWQVLDRRYGFDDEAFRAELIGIM